MNLWIVYFNLLDWGMKANPKSVSGIKIIPSLLIIYYVWTDPMTSLCNISSALLLLKFFSNIFLTCKGFQGVFPCLLRELWAGCSCVGLWNIVLYNIGPYVTWTDHLLLYWVALYCSGLWFALFSIVTCLCSPTSVCIKHGEPLHGHRPGGWWDSVYGHTPRLGPHWYGRLSGTGLVSVSLCYTVCCSTSVLVVCCPEINAFNFINMCLSRILFYVYLSVPGTTESRGEYSLYLVCDWWTDWKGSWVFSALYRRAIALVILGITVVNSSTCVS